MNPSTRKFFLGIIVTATVNIAVATPAARAQESSPLRLEEACENLVDSVAICIESSDSRAGEERCLAKASTELETCRKKVGMTAFVDMSNDEYTSNDTGGSTPTTTPARRNSSNLVDRWDPIIQRIAGQDSHLFAFLKSFVEIESGGLQYAVSPTSCAGLMQFCSGTARSEAFSSYFPPEQVHSCNCRGRCSARRSVLKALEQYDNPPAELRSQFPCNVDDARFDPKRSLKAGAAFINDLRARYGDNPGLVYVGYNSGPGVADSLYRLTSPPLTNLGRSSLKQYLYQAMLPHFGGSAASRAQRLAYKIIPKVGRSFRTYLREAQ